MHNRVKGSMQVCSLHNCSIADVAFDQAVIRAFSMIGDIVALDFRIVKLVEVIEYSNQVSATEQSIHQMTADKSSAASDQKIFLHLNSFCRGDAVHRPGGAMRRPYRLAPALDSVINSVKSARLLTKSRSGCHCTPTVKRRSGASTASMMPSSARAQARRPLP